MRFAAVGFPAAGGPHQRMVDSTVTPPTPRQALIARGEQAVLVVLALVLVAGVGYRAISWWRVGTGPLEVVPPPEGPTYRVNVNSADSATLSMVPGLGPTLAKRIIEVRDARPDRQFRSLDELKEVRGIGDKVLARLRPYLVLDNAAGAEEPVQMVPPPVAP